MVSHLLSRRISLPVRCDMTWLIRWCDGWYYMMCDRWMVWVLPSLFAWDSSTMAWRETINWGYITSLWSFHDLPSHRHWGRLQYGLFLKGIGVRSTHQLTISSVIIHVGPIGGGIGFLANGILKSESDYEMIEINQHYYLILLYRAWQLNNSQKGKMVDHEIMISLYHVIILR